MKVRELMSIVLFVENFTVRVTFRFNSKNYDTAIICWKDLMTIYGGYTVNYYSPNEGHLLSISKEV